jgi:hypothetical protein
LHWLELTCPLEENISVWHHAKLSKYEDEIHAEAQRNGWSFYPVILEVGARGWIPSSVNSALKRLGLPSVKELCNNLSHVALKSSYVIWLNRWNKDFMPWRLEGNRAQHRVLPSRSHHRSGPTLERKKPTVAQSAPKQMVKVSSAEKSIVACSMPTLQEQLKASGPDFKHSVPELTSESVFEEQAANSYKDLQEIVQGMTRGLAEIIDSHQVGSSTTPPVTAESAGDFEALKVECDYLATKILKSLSEPSQPSRSEELS